MATSFFRLSVFTLLLPLLGVIVPDGASSATTGLSLSLEMSETMAETRVIPILGVVPDDPEPRGTVAIVVVTFVERKDSTGLIVRFEREPGRFSHMAQTAIQQAIYRAARAAHLSSDSWTVMLANPNAGKILYGDSMSAMVSLTVVALAKHDFIPSDRVITGAVNPDGHIGPVGGLAFKVAAAADAHLTRVLVPDVADITNSGWRTPFLMHLSPVDTLQEAYRALTDHPLTPDPR